MNFTIKTLAVFILLILICLTTITGQANQNFQMIRVSNSEISEILKTYSEVNEDELNAHLGLTTNNFGNFDFSDFPATFWEWRAEARYQPGCGWYCPINLNEETYSSMIQRGFTPIL